MATHNEKSLKRRGFFRSKAFWIVAAVVIVVILIVLVKRGRTPAYEFVAVSRGPISESVSVTGNTAPVSSADLGFGSAGTIVRVNVSLGDHVSAGDILATLDMSDLAAQVKQAEASVAMQQAKLEGLQAGSRPEDIAASQAALDKAKQDLSNMYAGIADTSLDGYSKANDAVRTQLDVFFSNAETAQPHMTFNTSNSQAKNDAENLRVSASAALNAWQAALSANPSATDALDSLLASSLSYLSTVRNMLDDVSSVLQGVTNLDAATLATYKSDLSAAQTEVNTAIKNHNTIVQNIASQKLTVAQLDAQLNLKKAGSTPQDIDAQAAQVKSAQASLQSAEAKLANAEIVSPISGTVTKLEAKVGQLATVGQTLVTVISEKAFEVDAGVPETDVGKLQVGNRVDMTLDAFPNENFTGTVSYVDPAETNNGGVINYPIKVEFDQSDKRMKSGLTVNLTIRTRRKDDVLILPQYAILQNDYGTYVKTLINGVPSTTPVVLGLQDENGNVEVTSGVTEGEQVLNIGLKQGQ